MGRGRTLQRQTRREIQRQEQRFLAELRKEGQRALGALLEVINQMPVLGRLWLAVMIILGKARLDAERPGPKDQGGGPETDRQP